MHLELQGAEMPITMVSGPISRSTPKAAPGPPGSPGSARSTKTSYNPRFKKITYFFKPFSSTNFFHQFWSTRLAHQDFPPNFATHFSPYRAVRVPCWDNFIAFSAPVVPIRACGRGLRIRLRPRASSASPPEPTKRAKVSVSLKRKAQVCKRLASRFDETLISSPG